MSVQDSPVQNVTKDQENKANCCDQEDNPEVIMEKYVALLL